MARSGISSAERIKLSREIRIGIRNDGAVDLGAKKVAEEVKAAVLAEWDVAMGSVTGLLHPYETGQYRDSIHVERRRKRFGMPRYAVVSNDDNANFIEFGTGVDKPGSRSPWGPNTPTPEYAPFGKAAHRFGGTAP